jgi:phosphate transport system permease protein
MSDAISAHVWAVAPKRRPSVPAVVLAVIGIIALALGILYLADGTSLPGFLTAGSSEVGHGRHVLRGIAGLVVAAVVLPVAWQIGRTRWRTAADGGDWPAVPAARKIANLWYWIACYIALALVVGPALWLVGGVLAHAVPHWQWSVITTNTVGDTGGLKQAILGTLLITLGVLIIGGTISILTGLYLAEYASGRRRTVLRSGYEILAGIPSIVLGLVGYLVLVSVTGLSWKYGLLPAVLVLSVIVIPYITKATETSLLQVPASYREGADALGIPPGWTLRKIVIKSALPGIVTGLLIATAISVGETAPLLYTAGWSDFTPTLQLTGQPVAFLTYPVFSFFNLPVEGAKVLAYDAALLLLIFVLLVIIVGRVIVAWSRRHAE